jgi:transcriptional regulator with XRE-family HTH domain
MARKAVHPTPKAAPPAELPQEMTKHEFGRSLLERIVNNGWNQSDLARYADVGRDAISAYVRGKAFPEPKNLRKLAKAFGVEPEVLLPNVSLQQDSTQTLMELRQVQGQPGKAWLRINHIVTLGTASKVLALLQAEAEKDG